MFFFFLIIQKQPQIFSLFFILLGMPRGIGGAAERYQIKSSDVSVKLQIYCSMWVGFRFYIVQVNNIPSIKCQLSAQRFTQMLQLGQGQSMWLDLRRLISIVSRGSAATSYERGGNVLTRTIKAV